MNEESSPRIKSFTDCVAFLISAILSPYIMVLVFAVVMIYSYSENLQQFLPWMLTFLIFAVLVPGLYALWLLESKKITDLHMSKLEERKRPFIFASISALVGAVVLFLMGASQQVAVMAITYAINAIVVAIITQFWKISIHTALFSSVVTITVILFGLPYAWFYLILIPLSWSRIHRKRHTIWQAVAGAFLAFIITTLIFWMFGYV